MNKALKLLARTLILTGAASLAACSGNNDSDNSGSTTPVPVPSSTVSGVAAIGAAISNGSVALRCGDGINQTVTSGSDGAWTAFPAKAQGDVIITMDADLQDNPEEIPELHEMIVAGGFDLVSGWKKKRYDSVVAKNIPSKLFNWAARKTSGVQLNDFNCGLKAYKNIVVKNIEVSGEMHRYIPVLAKNAGPAGIGGDPAYFINGKVNYSDIDGKNIEIPFNY